MRGGAHQIVMNNIADAQSLPDSPRSSPRTGTSVRERNPFLPIPRTQPNAFQNQFWHSDLGSEGGMHTTDLSGSTLVRQPCSMLRGLLVFFHFRLSAEEYQRRILSLSRSVDYIICADIYREDVMSVCVKILFVVSANITGSEPLVGPEYALTFGPVFWMLPDASQCLTPGKPLCSRCYLYFTRYNYKLAYLPSERLILTTDCSNYFGQTKVQMRF
ncbi:hypothetical protein B0H11DRAFT_2434291 [Mycena galericulata]|nr:hypothetical protein B0H11DRAFT_2434291 [Mycena galericulata]